MIRRWRRTPSTSSRWKTERFRVTRMPLSEIFFLAIESLRANKLRAGLTMLGMIIGVGAVVLLVSIGNGAKLYVTTSFQGLGTNLIIVQPGKTDTKGGMGPPVGGVKRKLTL